MKKNVAKVDRIVRVLLGITIIVLYYINKLSGTSAYALIAVAGILIITGLVGWCPLYALLGEKKSS